MITDYLLDKHYIANLFREKIPRLGRLTEESLSVEIIKEDRKKGVETATVKYNLKGKEGLTVFCSAKSGGSKKKTFKILKLANKHLVTRQQALFYDQKTEALFYKGVKGEDLLNLVRNKEITKDEVKKVAQALFQFHSIPAPDIDLPVFSKKKREIMDPYSVLEENNPKKSNIQNRIKKLLREMEAVFLETKEENALCHGDFHPKNVLIEKGKENGISIIDFDYVCLADPRLDLGEFLQQFDFMTRHHINNKKRADIKKHFIESYVENLKSLKENFMETVRLYESWSSLRTSVYFIDDSYYNEDSANFLLDKVEKYLKNKK